MNLYAYCKNNPLLFIDDNELYPKSGYTIHGNKVSYRIDDENKPSEHISVDYRGKTYAWYKGSQKRHFRLSYEGGLENLPRRAKDELKELGVPDIAITLPSKEDTLEVFPSVEKESTITFPELPEKSKWY